MRIILLAALPEEADAVLPGQGDKLAGVWPEVRHLCLAGHDVFLATTGIGKVNIVSAAARLHALHDGEVLMTVGTAGKLSRIGGDCFYLARAIQHDYGARKADSFVHYMPGAWPMGPAHVAPYQAMPDPGTGLPPACITSGDAFIEDPAYAAHMVAALDADIVDMETAGVAQFALAMGVPWAGVKATTDDANHDSAGDFHQNLLAASDRAARGIERLIAALPHR